MAHVFQGFSFYIPLIFTDGYVSAGARIGERQMENGHWFKITGEWFSPLFYIFLSSNFFFFPPRERITKGPLHVESHIPYVYTPSASM